MPAEKRKVILQALQEAKRRGLSMAKGCEVLGLSKRNVERWLRPKEPEPGESRSRRPYNALAPSERELVREMLRSAELADFSVRELSAAQGEETAQGERQQA